MSDSIQSQIQKTRELLTKATSGPWHVGHISELDDSAAIDNPELLCVGRINIRPDQNLVCHARNVLPLYLEALEKAVSDIPHDVYVGFQDGMRVIVCEKECRGCKVVDEISAILSRGEGE